MAFDIYGNNLKPGHCEVHPQVAEEYPCSLCYADDRNKDIQRQQNRQRQEHYRQQEKEYYEKMEREHYESLAKNSSILYRMLNLASALVSKGLEKIDSKKEAIYQTVKNKQSKTTTP